MDFVCKSCFLPKRYGIARYGIVITWYGDLTVEDGLSNHVKFQLPMNPTCHFDTFWVRLPEIGSQISLPSYGIFLMPIAIPH